MSRAGGCNSLGAVLAGIIMLSGVTLTSSAAQPVDIQLARKNHDPYGAPRPAPDQLHVPLRSTFYVELVAGDQSDVVLAETIDIRLQAAGGEPIHLLRASHEFAAGYRGRIFPGKESQGRQTLIVYADPSNEQALLPDTRYTVSVSARSKRGAALAVKDRTWHFTTESPAAGQFLEFELALDAEPVRWHGGFFTGFCSTSFCTSHSNRIPTYELMEQTRRVAPRAWSLQRDFWMTGMEHQPRFLSGNLPNIVRERETRRITAIEPENALMRIRTEDFFGHQQYGIPSGRLLSEDYQEGDEILIADGVHDARAKVVRVDNGTRSLTVTPFETPGVGWKIAYSGPLPTREDPNAPGLFPPGGCYLRKFNPPGTPVYYWGRLDKEWDLVYRRFKRRLVPNFADAPGDLALDGRSWTTAKDYAELHEVVRAITSHVIERYGEATLSFPWSVFNEPDLINFFWRSDWNELQKFYDYATDGILRAFEDHGYDSDRVFVGGLELGGIFGTNLRLREFLVHCSPRAALVPGALPLNEAFRDSRLNGKRSRRVESLCRANEGRGAPCDFISIHSYNKSKVMADKLARAKEMALEVDPEYYASLWINSHESCPGWNMPPDPAFADSYLGNGYYPTWCADVVRRQLQRAAGDSRYAYGETILTFWPWPTTNFGGANDCVRQIHVDDDGDGTADRRVTVAMPILHFLGRLALMGDCYWVLPELTVGGHAVSGFASRAEERLYLLLYSHSALDTESRSDADFNVTVRVSGFSAAAARLQEYHFDKNRNTYFQLGRSLRESPMTQNTPESSSKEIQTALTELAAADPDTQLAGVARLERLGPAAASAIGAIAELSQNSDDATVRSRSFAALLRINQPRAFPAGAVRQVEELAKLNVTGQGVARKDNDGKLLLQLQLAGNGAVFVELRPMAE